MINLEPKIILHGGIESFIEEHELLQKQEALESVCMASYEFLRKNSALDAVEYSIKMLEDNPLFNAGTGAILQSDAVQRMDAAIMDGYVLKAGAVTQIRGVKRYNGTLTRELFEKWFKIRDKVPHGTVGAVAVDEYGHIAAGTSTGGW